jgi:hypothetical protein
MKALRPLSEDDDDPMLSAVNLVDVFLVLVVALLTAVALQHQPAGDGGAVVRNAGRPDMEMVVREHGREVSYRGSGGASAGDGVRAGVAYRMKDGSIVYVPESEDRAR